MPSQTIYPSFCGCIIRRDVNEPPILATEGEPYLLQSGGTRGWFGFDVHSGEPVPYYGMVVCLEYDLSSIPADATINYGQSTYVEINVENYGPINGPVIAAIPRSWTSPFDDSDYGTVLANQDSDIFYGVAIIGPGTYKVVFSPAHVQLQPGVVNRIVLCTPQGNRSIAKLNADNRRYVRISFGATTPALVVNYTTPPPVGSGEVHGVITVTIGEGTVVSSAYGEVHGRLEVLSTSGSQAPSANGEVHGRLEIEVSAEVGGPSCRGEVHGLLFVDVPDAAVLPGAGEVHGVLLVDISQSQGTLPGQGEVHGLLMVQIEGVGQQQDSVLSDVLPFSVTGTALVVVETNPVFLSPQDISGVGSIQVNAFDAGLSLGRCELTGAGTITAELTTSGDAEVVATAVIAGRLTYGMDTGA